MGARKQKLLAKGIPDPTLPSITVNGKYYGKTLPILRFLSHKLGKYEGDNEDEAQLLDVYTDIINDWTVAWVNVTFLNSTEEEKTCPQVFKTWESILSKTKGPFVLVEKISYADFSLFHMLEEITHIKASAKTYPHISTFVEAFENRSNLKKYLATNRV